MRILHVSGDRLRTYINSTCTSIAAARLVDVLESFGHTNDEGNVNNFANLDVNQFTSILGKTRGIRVGQSSVRAFMLVKKWLLDTERAEAQATLESSGSFCGIPQGILGGAETAEDVATALRIAAIKPAGTDQRQKTTPSQTPPPQPQTPPPLTLPGDAAPSTYAVDVRLTPDKLSLTPDQMRALAQLFEAFGRPSATLDEIARVAISALSFEDTFPAPAAERSEAPADARVPEPAGILTDFPDDTGPTA